MAFAPYRAADLFEINASDFMSEGGFKNVLANNRFPPELIATADTAMFGRDFLSTLAPDDLLTALNNLQDSLLAGLTQEEMEQSLKETLNNQDVSVKLMDAVEREQMITLLATLDLGATEASQDQAADASEFDTMELDRNFTLEAALNTAVTKASAMATSINGVIPAYDLDDIAAQAGLPIEMIEAHPDVMTVFADQLNRSLEIRGFKVDFDAKSIEGDYEQEVNPVEPEESVIEVASTPVPQFEEPDPDAIFRPSGPGMGFSI